MVLCQIGVKQGFVAAPDLFNCAIDHVMTQVCQRITAVRLGIYYLTDLEYADDNTFSDTVADPVAGLSIFQEEAFKFGLQVSWEKTKLMSVGDGTDPPPIVIGSTTIDFVDSWNYIRPFILSKGDLSR